MEDIKNKILVKSHFEEEFLNDKVRNGRDIG